MTAPLKTSAAATKAEPLHAKPTLQRGMISDAAPRVSSPSNHLMTFHRTLGNQAVQRFFKSGFIQAKLEVGDPHDVYEQEAHREADRIMRMPEEAPFSPNSQSLIPQPKIQLTPG